MTLGGAAQVATAHCLNERTLDPTVCSYNRPTNENEVKGLDIYILPLTGKPLLSADNSVLTLYSAIQLVPVFIVKRPVTGGTWHS